MSEDRFSEIDKHIDQISNPNDIAGLYNEDFVNWRGPTTPDKEKSFYTDYIAKKLLAELDIKNLYPNISNSTRDSYFVDSHDGVTKKHTKRTEEIFAKNLLGHSLEHLGKIVGYQMPLKASQEDNYGKVDLISYDQNKKTAYLIELKMAEKKETLLRAALEVETYHQLVQPKPLNEYLGKKKDRFGISTPTKYDDLTIKKVVLFALNGIEVPKELLPEKKRYYSNLWNLVSDLEIGVYTIPHTYPVTMHKNPNT